MRDENSVKIARIASALERTYSLRYFMNLHVFHSLDFMHQKHTLLCQYIFFLWMLTFWSICSIHLINPESFSPFNEVMINERETDWE